MTKYKPNINLKDKNNTLTNIFSRVAKNSKVLDIGCASGYFDKVLRDKKECEVVGIEIDPEDAKLAEKYCKFVAVSDIEGQEWEKKLKGSRFDHIIFADVLEHLKKPEEVLKRVKKYLAKGGTVLISIPNIAHISVRLELLNGDFIPEETGILDDTHLKYFTKSTFSDLVGLVGYKIKWLSQSSFDFPEDTIKKYLSKIGLKATLEGIKKLNSPEAVALQYIFELVPDDKAHPIDRVNEKPIYVVREFLKLIEKDHKKFKEDEAKHWRAVEEELQKSQGLLTYRIEKKVRRLLKK